MLSATEDCILFKWQKCQRENCSAHKWCSAIRLQMCSNTL